MAKYFRNAVSAITYDLYYQFRRPTKSLTGYVCTRIWDKANAELVETTVRKAAITPDSNVLEIGYGLGRGLQLCYDITKDGDGVVFGVEHSKYMEMKATMRLFDEMLSDKKVELLQVPLPFHFPFPNAYLDCVYHIDVFYFWPNRILPGLLAEMMRIIKPGGKMICGMEIAKLEKYADYKIVNRANTNPVRYMSFLEPAGFADVKIEYEKSPTGREYQIISATRPEVDEFATDPEDIMKELEMDIKTFLATQSLMMSDQYEETKARMAQGEFLDVAGKKKAIEELRAARREKEKAKLQNNEKSEKSDQKKLEE